MAADGGRSGYQHLLDGFWHEAKLHGVAMPVDEPVSAPAFCNARKKLSPTAVRQLLRDASDEFDRRQGRRHRVQGRRVLAVDGSQVPLQRAPELWKEFGGPSNGYTPQAMVSVLVDVIAKMPLDAVITPYVTDERAQLGQLLSATREGDILVLDRGFQSFGVIDMLIERGLDFVLRMPLTRTFHVVEDFVRSGRDQADIVLTPPARSPAHLVKARRLRAVRRVGPEGKPQVFLTTLPRRQFSHAKICDLYQRRWEIELLYRLEKSDYIGQRQFHAKFPAGVRQEVFAFLLFIAITRTLMSAASKTCRAPYERISQKRAILASARALTALLLESEADQARRILAELLHHIAARLDPKRRHRSCPRRSFKPRSRWGPHGHRRAVWKKEKLR